MNHKQDKLENPARLVELNPEETLKKIGIGTKDVFSISVKLHFCNSSGQNDRQYGVCTGYQPGTAGHYLR